jgi:ankyrin repeat protein
MQSRPFPAHPSLEQYRKQAKDLLKACTSGEPDSIREWVRRWVESYADQEAETQASLRAIILTKRLRETTEREEIARVEKIIRESNLTKPAPRLADAQFFVARAHGFESWPRFSKHLQALERRQSPDARFEAAADAIVSGDIRTLEKILAEDPGLVTARSQRAHNATLLHYVAANGVENFRQKTPRNIVEITRLLLDAGADVDAGSNAYGYGGGSTALGMAATSFHPLRAGLQESLMQILLERGADMDRPGVAGNGHTAVEGCLWNGRGKAAAFLASRGARLNLETAAGTGRMDVVVPFFFEDGRLRPSATPTQLQRGFLWACEYGFDDVVEFLLERGADLRDQAGTGEAALHWAVVACNLPMVRLLLKHGAPLEELNAYGGTALGQAGWSFDHGAIESDYIPIFEVLLAAGSKIEDGWFEWLEHKCVRPAADRLRVAEVFRRYGATT